MQFYRYSATAGVVNSGKVGLGNRQRQWRRIQILLKITCYRRCKFEAKASSLILPLSTYVYLSFHF
jgi:hypothetical protein